MIEAIQPQPPRPRARRGPIVAKVTAALRGTHLSDKVKVFGTEYELRTLEPHETSWADGFAVGLSFVQAGRARRAPIVAKALVSIGGAPVEQVFEFPPDASTEAREAILSDPEELEDWRRREVLEWLVKDTSDEVIERLYQFWLGLTKRRMELQEQIDPLSTTTPTGESSLTSSPTKDVSSPILSASR